jgi:ABC-type dipeptide/oligopeptide/nickel transport system permease component
MGSITIQSFLFLIGNLISDLIYVGVDPRIDFSESSSKSG